MISLLAICLLSAGPTQLEIDVAALHAATERFETARAAVAAADTQAAAQRVILRAARSALYAAMRKVQEDLAEVAPQPTPAPPRPVVWSEPLPVRIVYPIYPPPAVYDLPICTPLYCPTRIIYRRLP